MESERYIAALHLELEGRIAEAGALLGALAAEHHPLALIELGFRHLVEPSSDDEHFCPGKDEVKSAELVEAGKRGLLAFAEEGDGEAMRMLGYLQLNLLGPYGASLTEAALSEAESWFHRSFEAGCHFSANELFTFYRGRDDAKARHWLAQARKYDCLVVEHEGYET